jgi:predicted nuclease of restriction endonuclease-like (RecB) superfamily
MEEVEYRMFLNIILPQAVADSFLDIFPDIPLLSNRSKANLIIIRMRIIVIYMGEVTAVDYVSTLEQIKHRINNARYQALRSVNRELICLYWDIGRIITEKQQDEGYGKSLIEKLARDIQRDYPGIKGFSARNLWRMRNIYLAYYNKEKLPQLVAEIGWGHNIVILEKCDSDQQREYYVSMAAHHGWSREILVHQIESRAYERAVSSQTNFGKTLPHVPRAQSILAMNDEYIFDFLDLGDEYKERELEAALISRVENFLREMGGNFAFIGSQYRLEVGGKEYFIDLLLYHRALRCLVAIELKIGEFMPEHVGKMQFYLAVLDDMVRIQEESPSIGIIICKSKDKTIVEYALRDTKRPMGVASYTMTPRLPDELEGKMPGPEVMAKLLKD